MRGLTSLAIRNGGIAQRRSLVLLIVASLLASIGSFARVDERALASTSTVGPPPTVTYYVSDGQGGDPNCDGGDGPDTSTGNYADDALAVQDALYLAATDGTAGVAIIHLCAGSFDLSSGISVTTGDDSEVIIEGEGTSGTTSTTVTRSSETTGEFNFFFVTGVATTFRLMTVTNAAGGGINNGGAVYSNRDVTANTVVFADNTTGGLGGAIYARNLTVSDGTFTGNVAVIDSNGDGGSGGAVWATQSVAITDSVFDGNLASGVPGSEGFGGAVYAQNAVSVTDGQFTGNSATTGGGAIFSLLGQVSVDGSIFEDNQSPGVGYGSGGAIYSNLSVVVVDAWFERNSAADVGGAIFTADDVSSDPSTYVDNTAGTGGAIYAGTSVTTIGDTFLRNSATSVNGGAIFAEGDVTASDGTFTDNTAGVNGGAIFAEGDVTASDGTFTDNTAGVNGGAISSIAGDVTLISSDFTTNTAVNRGGAIFTLGAVTIVGGSFADNTTGGGADRQGGAIYAHDVSVTDGTFANNRAGNQGGAIWAQDHVASDQSTYQDNTAGNQGGAIYSNSGRVSSISDTFLRNTATSDNGGAIWANGGVDATAATFVGNVATNGGGLATDGAPITIDGGSYAANRATNGGGVAYAPTGLISASGGSFIGNHANDGGVLAAPNGSLSVEGGDFSANTAQNGGALYTQGTVSVTDGIFTENTATAGSGGAIWAVGTVTVIGTEFSSNTSSVGGGAIRTEGAAVITGAEFVDNTTGGEGGAIKAISPSVDASTFRMNRAGAAGGAVWSSGAVSISDSTFVANTAQTISGGAIFKNGTALLAVSGSTFSENTAGSEGGAIYNEDAGSTATIVNSTFVGNQATSGGGAIRATTAEITNGTFWDNTAGTGDHLSITGGSSTDSIYAGGDCAIGSATETGANLATDASCPDNGSTVSASDLDLQPLADNGGPTFTVAITDGSVAFNAVTSCAVAVDQRGVARPQGAKCDTGAFEAEVEASTITTQASVRGVDLTSGVPSITSGDLVTDVATVTGSATDGSGGFIDPTSGSVDFYYCYDPTSGSNPFTECTSGTWTLAGNDEMSGGTDATDGIATATLEDWAPPNGGGWYLISAVYDSSGGTNAGSETTGDTVHELIRVLYDSTTETSVDPTTGGFGALYTDSIKVYGLAPHPSGSGYLDPTGKVRIYYCYNLNTQPTDCSAGSGYPIATLSLTDGTSGTDGIGEATLSSWLPPQAGYYLLHAVYRGDDVYAPSEDDGTNEEIFAAYTTVVYTGETYDSVTDGTTRLSATVTGPSPCVVGGSVTFTVRDLSGGIISVQLIPLIQVGSGNEWTAFTPVSYLAGIYEVEVTGGGSVVPECSGGTDLAILTVVIPGETSNGGGYYKPDKTGGTQWSGNPRVNFGYNVTKTVKKSGTTTTTTYRGQLLWLNKNLFRIKGTFFSQTTGTGGIYGTFTCPKVFTDSLGTAVNTATKCGSAAGSGILQQWSDVYGWQAPGIFPATVTFTITMYDAGQLKSCKKQGKTQVCSLTDVPGDWFGIQVNEVPTTGIRESAPVKLLGGAVKVL